MLNSDSLPDEIQKDMISKKISPAQKKDVAERFENMQVDAGEAVGIITAQSLGEPGTQMSLKFDEKVLVKYKENVKSVKIGEFIDKIIETQPSAKEHDYEIYDIPESSRIEVLSLDKNEQLIWKQIRALSRHKNHEELLKLKLRSGREITATKSHSFVVRKNNKIIPIAGQELKLGDRLPVIRNLNFSQEINAIDLSVYNKNARRKLPEILELTEQIGWLFGAYLAEGNATPNFVNISNNSSIFLQQIQGFSDDFNLTVNVYQHNRGFSDSTDIRINSTALSNLLKSSCSTGSYNKKIPDFAINANRQFLRGLLRAFFDGDGNISVDRKCIRAYSKSKQLIEGIALLLNRFGIFSRKSENKEGHTLTISYRYAKIFLDEIGLDIPEKAERLKKLATVSDSDKQYNVTEMYVGFADILYQLAEKLKYPKRQINSFTRRQKIGRPTLKRYIDVFSALADKKKINIGKEINILQQMYNSDVIWDEIIGAEYVTDKHNHLYDFSVDGLETFTTSEGIVTHNTMRTFHFVGVSELNVTLGLPRIIEVLDARKEPKTPMMNIYLKAPHNKSFAGADKVANKIKQVSLEDIAVEFTMDLVSIRLIVKLNPELCKRHGMTTKQAADSLVKQLKGNEVKVKDNSLLISSTGGDIKKLYKLKEKIRRLHVSGVPDISHVLAVKREDEYIIQTYGTNLKKVILIDEVDENRTTSNNLYETYKVFGIEATRERIVQEIMMVLEQEGLDVDIRHIMLIADAMCRSGELKGITRHGITSEKQSVLARASFETPLRHLVEASIIGEEDKLTSVVENIMINQPIPLGTGLPELVVKMKPSKSSAAKPKTVKKETTKKKGAKK